MRTQWIVVTVLLAGLIAVGTYAQARTDSASHGAMHASPHEMGGMMAADQDMMKDRQHMMSDMKAANAELDRLVTEMSSATGAAKSAAMEKLLVKLVARHEAMNQRMMAMGPDMMAHMKAHMMSGSMEDMRQSMSMCPMMSGADDDAAHSSHHPETQD